MDARRAATLRCHCALAGSFGALSGATASEAAEASQAERVRNAARQAASIHDQPWPHAATQDCAERTPKHNMMASARVRRPNVRERGAGKTINDSKLSLSFNAKKRREHQHKHKQHLSPPTSQVEMHHLQTSLQLTATSPLDGVRNRFAAWICERLNDYNDANKDDDTRFCQPEWEKQLAARGLARGRVFAQHPLTGTWGDIRSDAEWETLLASWVQEQPRIQHSVLRVLGETLFSMLESSEVSARAFAIHALWDLVQREENIQGLVIGDDPGAVEQRLGLVMFQLNDSRPIEPTFSVKASESGYVDGLTLQIASAGALGLLMSKNSGLADTLCNKLEVHRKVVHALERIPRDTLLGKGGADTSGSDALVGLLVGLLQHSSPHHNARVLDLHGRFLVGLVCETRSSVCQRAVPLIFEHLLCEDTFETNPEIATAAAQAKFALFICVMLQRAAETTTTHAVAPAVVRMASRLLRGKFGAGLCGFTSKESAQVIAASILAHLASIMQTESDRDVMHHSLTAIRAVARQFVLHHAVVPDFIARTVIEALLHCVKLLPKEEVLHTLATCCIIDEFVTSFRRSHVSVLDALHWESDVGVCARVEMSVHSSLALILLAACSTHGPTCFMKRNQSLARLLSFCNTADNAFAKMLLAQSLARHCAASLLPLEEEKPTIQDDKQRSWTRAVEALPFDDSLGRFGVLEGGGGFEQLDVAHHASAKPADVTELVSQEEMERLCQSICKVSASLAHVVTMPKADKEREFTVRTLQQLVVALEALLALPLLNKQLSVLCTQRLLKALGTALSVDIHASLMLVELLDRAAGQSDALRESIENAVSTTLVDAVKVALAVHSRDRANLSGRTFLSGALKLLWRLAFLGSDLGFHPELCEILYCAIGEETLDFGFRRLCVNVVVQLAIHHGASFSERFTLAVVPMFPAEQHHRLKGALLADIVMDSLRSLDWHLRRLGAVLFCNMDLSGSVVQRLETRRKGGRRLLEMVWQPELAQVRLAGLQALHHWVGKLGVEGQVHFATYGILPLVLLGRHWNSSAERQGEFFAERKLLDDLLHNLAEIGRLRTIFFHVELATSQRCLSYEKYQFPWSQEESSPRSGEGLPSVNQRGTGRRVSEKASCESGGSAEPPQEFAEWLDETFGDFDPKDHEPRPPGREEGSTLTSSVKSPRMQRVMACGLKQPVQRLWNQQGEAELRSRDQRWSPRVKNLDVVAPDKDCAKNDDGDTTSDVWFENRDKGSILSVGPLRNTPSKSDVALIPASDSEGDSAGSELDLDSKAMQEMRRKILAGLGVKLRERRFDMHKVRLVLDKPYTFSDRRPGGTAKRSFHAVPHTRTVCMFRHIPGSRVYKRCGMRPLTVSKDEAVFVYSTVRVGELEAKVDVPTSSEVPEAVEQVLLEHSFASFVREMTPFFFKADPANKQAGARNETPRRNIVDLHPPISALKWAKEAVPAFAAPWTRSGKLVAVQVRLGFVATDFANVFKQGPEALTRLLERADDGNDDDDVDDNSTMASTRRRRRRAKNKR